jgi:glycosyltransferase involved in cell wall biosynthesis
MKGTVLVLVGYYLPGFKGGGPTRSIENLVAILGEEFHFRIVTMDRDLGDNVPYPDVVANIWVRAGLAEVFYMRPGWQGLLKMATLLHSVNSETVLYLNSFFSPRFSILPMFMASLRLCRPRSIVLAPRGEFSPGALNQKMKKKRLYLRFSRLLGIYKGIIWHSSTGLEAGDLRTSFPELPDPEPVSSFKLSLAERAPVKWGEIKVAQDIPARIGLPIGQRRLKNAGELRLVFISRISPMKNLLYALRLLDGVTGEVAFDIYGPAEDMNYWGQCQKIIAALPVNVRVKYYGEIEHGKINQKFADYDLFLLPTLGENYGHVISEALAAGCPVLISNLTPWRNLEEEGVGWDIPLDNEGRFRAVLQACIDSDDKQQVRLSDRAIKYAEKRMDSPEITDANRRLFQHAFITKTQSG